MIKLVTEPNGLKTVMGLTRINESNSFFYEFGYKSILKSSPGIGWDSWTTQNFMLIGREQMSIFMSNFFYSGHVLKGFN